MPRKCIQQNSIRSARICMSYRTSWSPDCQTLVRNCANQYVKLVNLSGFEQYQLSPNHHQDRSNGEVVRWISEFYNEQKERIRISSHVVSSRTDVFGQEESSNSGPGQH